MVDTVPGAELVKVFTEAQLSQEDCELVAQKFEIDTVKKFVDIFDPETATRPSGLRCSTRSRSGSGSSGRSGA